MCVTWLHDCLASNIDGAEYEDGADCADHDDDGDGDNDDGREGGGEGGLR